MHATPESFGPNQSPLAADLACARLPYHRTAPSRTAPTFAARERTTFRRLTCLLVDRFQPRGSRAPYGPLWTSDASSASRVLGKHWPLIVEANQSPPNQVRVLKVRCSHLFSEESRMTGILLASPDRRESALLGWRGSQHRGRTR